MSDENDASTLLHRLQERASQYPDQILYAFLSDGEGEEVRLSYGELDRTARAIASELQRGAPPGARALMLYPPGLEFITAFFGCLYAGIIAVPAYPPRNPRNVPRIQTIASDAEASLCLTNSAVISRSKALFGIVPGLEQMRWLATDELGDAPPASWAPSEINRETLAFIQYTSGSTSSPKGVMVSHGNLMHNLGFLCDGRGHTGIVSWLPFFHDMGLIYGILQALYGGIPCLLMAPASFLQRPLRWLQALSRSQASTAIAPNFAYELCAEKISDSDKETLDLSHWAMALNAAEPVRADTLQRFAAAFARCGFRGEFLKPAYGLAEATLGVSIYSKPQTYCVRTVHKSALEQHRVVAGEAGSEQSWTLIGCGQGARDQAVAIVNPETLRRCAPNEVGEIWLSSPSVAKGYWRKPKETEETFRAFVSDTGEGPFLRTGDLGFSEDGELFITGRVKDLIIIRGGNHYPQDLELTVQKSHAALQPDAGAAFSVEFGGEERLVVVQELIRHHKADLDEVIGAIRSAVAEEHGLQIHALALVAPHEVPKTSSGKIQRRACRSQFLDGSLKLVKSWTFTADVGTDPAPQTVRVQASEPLSGRADPLIQWLRGYASERINSRLMDERRCIPPYVVLDLGNKGLLGMQIPERYGGLGFTNAEMVRVIEQMAAIDLTLALLVSLNNTLGIRPIQRFASPDLREEFLPLLAQGRELAAFALTEPGAGSNPRAIESLALPDGGGWRLQGTKIWSGSASWSGLMNVFVKAGSREGNVAGFAVRQRTPGLRQGPEALTLGMRGMVQNTIHLEAVPVSPAHLLGRLHEGMEVAQDAMMFARLVLGAMSLGGMKRCAQLMVRYASRRSVATGRLIENPITASRLSSLAAAITSLEVFVARTAALLDEGKPVPPEALVVCKNAGAEFLWHAADDLVQVLGGRGYIESNIAPQILRDARVLRVFEGPTETLNFYLGSRVLNQSPELKRFLSAELGATNVALKLWSAVEELRTREGNPSSSFTAPGAGWQWISHALGQAASFGLLAAALEENQKQAPSEESRRALHWANGKFDRALERVLQKPKSAAWLLAPTEADGLVAKYAVNIGDLEQTLPGADETLDLMLRRDLVRPTGGSRKENEPPTAATASSISDVEKETETTIRNWLMEKVAKVAGVQARSLDPAQPFTHHGLDSVIMVSLSQDVSDWLRRELPATLLWSYPTIESLARFLADASAPEAEGIRATGSTSAGSPKPGGSMPTRHETSPAGNASEIEKLSEEEMAVLLAEELALVQQRKNRPPTSNTSEGS